MQVVLLKYLSICIIHSGVPAWLGLKTAALAWLNGARALNHLRTSCRPTFTGLLWPASAPSVLSCHRAWYKQGVKTLCVMGGAARLGLIANLVLNELAGPVSMRLCGSVDHCRLNSLARPARKRWSPLPMEKLGLLAGRYIPLLMGKHGLVADLCAPLPMGKLGLLGAVSSIIYGNTGSANIPVYFVAYGKAGSRFICESGAY